MPVKLEILFAELLSNFPGGGGTGGGGTGGGGGDHLFGPRRGEFEKKISKNSNALGVAQGGGMLKLRFDWYIMTLIALRAIENDW